MKPRRTIASSGVLRLEGGTEDNDLWFTSRDDGAGGHVFETVWEPTPEERAAIARGESVLLYVWGRGHPPVAVETTDVELGRG